MPESIAGELMVEFYRSRDIYVPIIVFIILKISHVFPRTLFGTWTFEHETSRECSRQYQELSSMYTTCIEIKPYMCRPGIELSTPVVGRHMNRSVHMNCCLAAQKRFSLFKGPGSLKKIKMGRNVEYLKFVISTLFPFFRLRN